MILVTVGAQMPFDRLVAAVDRWAVEAGREDVFAQIGRSRYRPRNIRFSAFVDPAQLQDCFRQADLIISHAGAGSVLNALWLKRPILVMPRRAYLKETRNDHQVAMARRFERLGYVTVARDESEIREKLRRIDRLPASRAIGCDAQPRLLEAVRRFIEEPGKTRTE